MILLVSVVMGIVPMVVYAAILWWLDRWEKEPLPLLGAVFLWGFVPSACFALISQLIIDVPASYIYYYSPLAYELFGASIVAPLTEEFIKAVAVGLVYLFFRKEFDSVLDGIIYGSLVGFGFAAIENILYFISFGSEDPASLGCLIFLRAFLFGLNHAFFTSLTGIGFALARYERSLSLRLLYPLVGLLGAMFVHGLHNFLATFGLLGLPFAALADWMGALGVLIVAIVSLRHERTWIRRYLADEVERGTLTAAQAARAGSFTARLFVGWGALARGLTSWYRTRHFYRQCAELAFKKHQFQKMGEERGNRARIERLREEVAALSRTLA